MMSVGDSIFVRMVPYILTLALSLGEYSIKKGVKKTKFGLTSFSYRRPWLFPIDRILRSNRQSRRFLQIAAVQLNQSPKTGKISVITYLQPY